MINYLMNVDNYENIQKLSIFLFIIESIVYLCDSQLTKKHINVVRPRKITAYLGIFMPLFSIWLGWILKDDCKTDYYDVLMMFSLCLVIDIIGFFLLLLRINGFCSYSLEPDSIMARKLFIFRKVVRMSEIQSIEQKSDRIQINLKNGKKLSIDFMFENLEYLIKILKQNGIHYTY